MIAFSESSGDLPLEIIDTRTCLDLCVLSITLDETLRVVPGRRTVYRGHWLDRRIILKCYFKWQRDLQREWIKLNKLYTLGIPVAEPLFIARKITGEFFLVMSEIQKAVDLQTLLIKKAHEPQLRQVLFQELMLLLARQHEAGVYQSDNHLGNFLWDDKTLYVVDAASFRFEARPLSPSKRVDNLATLFISGDLSWQSEFETALPNYLERINKSALNKSLVERLQKSIPFLQKKRLLKYQKKTDRSCTDLDRRRVLNRTILFDREFPPKLQHILCDNPDSLVVEGAIIKDGNTCKLASFAFEGREYVIKRYNPKSFVYRLRHVAFLSRARRSWRFGLTWRLLGLPSPRPFACVEERSGFFIKQAFVIFEKIHGERLDQFILKKKNSTDQLRPIVIQFITLWRLLNKIRAAHGDMKASNFMVSDEGKLLMIDFDHSRFFIPAFLYKKRRHKEWKRFMKNWESHPDILELFEKAMTSDLNKNSSLS